VTAAQDADICLVVTTPSRADIWEAEDAVRFATLRNPGAIVRVGLQQVRKTTILGRLAEESPQQTGGDVLGVKMSSRECHRHAMGGALDRAAREEVLQLSLAVISLLSQHRLLRQHSIFVHAKAPGPP
jgi:hypothetical protein